MPVRKVGSCRILREIGRGGMGTVYEAYQDGLDRRVAVKALDAKRARSRDLAERFRREGRAYAQIGHPAILTVHDLVEKDETLYLVTEFVDGADLQRIVAARGPLPPDCVAALGARLADALDCVHAHALLHRDLKPSNVMIARSGEVKLMDFGVAKDALATELTRTGAVVGTPAYVAPEVLEGDDASERSDLWALGVTLYEVATGRRPFQGEGFQELFAAVRKGAIEPVRDVAPRVPRRLARAIERCLARRPSRRWASAGALAYELQACAEQLLDGARGPDRLAALVAALAEGEAGAVPATPPAASAPAPPDASRPADGASPPRGRVVYALLCALALAGAYAWIVTRS